MERIDICWVEEAQKVSDHSWKILIPTIRRDASEVWISFNPELEDDPTAIRFLKNTPPNSIVLKVNWQDNPWLPQVLKDEADHLRATDPEEYFHVWEGQFWSRSDAQIFNKKWAIVEFTPGADWYGPLHGIDFGFSTTPTCIGRQWIHKDCLWVEEAYGGLRIETVDLPAQLDRIEDSKGFTWRADSARPETISFLNNAGYTVVGAEKGPGSVEDGLSFMKSFDRINIHPRAKMACEQIRLYRFKTDRHTGEVLKQIEKKHDDWSDQCRYALEPLIKGRTGSMADVI
jgi:phage terminase large subunit